MKRKAICEDMMEQFEVYETFGEYLVYSGATFHYPQKANNKNVRICGTEQPHVALQVIATRRVSKTGTHGHLFAEATVTGTTYVYML
jgi:hypothetical protein